MTRNEHGTATAPRSTFVSAVAWICVVLTSFGTLISILRNVMIDIMVPPEAFGAAAETSGGSRNIPWFEKFMMNHVRLFVFGFLAVSITTLDDQVGRRSQHLPREMCAVIS